MSGLFYFLPVSEDQFPIPTDGAVNQEKLQQLGLGHLHDCQQWGRDLIGSRVHANGPDAKSGICLFVRPVGSDGNETVQNYQPQRQTWLRGIGGDFWVGCLQDAPPTAEELIRWKPLNGFTIADRSQRQWLVPVARLPEQPFGSLPTSFDFDDAGNPIARVRCDCNRLWEIGGKFFDLWSNEQIDTIDDEEAIDLVIEVMSANYRVSKSEIRLLTRTSGDVIDSDFVFLVTQIVSGYYREAGKKKEEVTPTSPA